MPLGHILHSHNLPQEKKIEVFVLRHLKHVPCLSAKIWTSICRGVVMYFSTSMTLSPKAPIASDFALLNWASNTSAVIAIRMPLPPPPFTAFISTGNPILEASDLRKLGSWLLPWLCFQINRAGIDTRMSQQDYLLSWDTLDSGLDHNFFGPTTKHSATLTHQGQSDGMPFVAHGLHCLPWRPYEHKSCFRTFSCKS